MEAWKKERKKNIRSKRGRKICSVVVCFLLFDESENLVWDATLIYVSTQRKGKSEKHLTVFCSMNFTAAYTRVSHNSQATIYLALFFVTQLSIEIHQRQRQRQRQRWQWQKQQYHQFQLAHQTIRKIDTSNEILSFIGKCSVVTFGSLCSIVQWSIVLFRS